MCVVCLVVGLLFGLVCGCLCVRVCVYVCLCGYTSVLGFAVYAAMNGDVLCGVGVCVLRPVVVVWLCVCPRVRKCVGVCCRLSASVCCVYVLN